MKRVIAGAAIGVSVLWLLALAGPAAALTNDECVTCHGSLDPGMVYHAVGARQDGRRHGR